MNVSLNGSTRVLPEVATVVDAIEAAGHRGTGFGIAVALNGEVVPRSAWAATHLSEHDRVEVLVAAQGG
jgi:sulfur carrier protein